MEPDVENARSVNIDRIRKFAVRYFETTGGQWRWPTVAQTARSLRVRQVDVQDAIEGTDCCIDLTGYDLDEPIGSKFVEVFDHTPKDPDHER